MRIIAGALGGRNLKTVEGPGYRPATAKVREAIFSMLSSRGVVWSGLRVLDLFAGSGSLSGTACTKPRLNSPPKNGPFRAIVQNPPPTSPQGTHFRADFPEKPPQNALPVEKIIHDPPILPVQLLLPPVQRRLRPVHFPTCPRAISVFPPLPFFQFSVTFIPIFFGKFVI